MRVREALLSTALVTVFVLAGTAPAFAVNPSTFGTHVRDCAQTMGFGGSHNPSVHHGPAGWDGARCQ